MCRFITSLGAKIIIFTLLFSTGGLAQQATQDSLRLIQEYQQKAAEALKTQSFQEAIVNLTTASTMVTDIKNDSLQASIRLEVAALHYKLHNYDKAKTEAESALEFLRAERDRLKLAKARTLYGMIMTELGDYETAGRNLNEASSVLSSLNENYSQSKALLGLAVLQIKQERYTDAVNYLDAAIANFEQYKTLNQQLLYSIWRARGFNWCCYWQWSG